MSLINIYDILIITMNAKIHHEQIIKKLPSQDGISITDFSFGLGLQSGSARHSPGFTPTIVKGHGFCFRLSPAESPFFSPLDASLAYFLS